MAGMPEVVQFVPEHASRPEWQRHHAYRRTVQVERRPDEPLPPDDVVELMMKRPDPRQHHHRYQVVDGGEMVGELYAEGPRPDSPEYATNRHLLFAWVYVLKAARGRGIGTSLVPKVLGLMEENGATVLSTMAEDDPGHEFIGRLGAEPKLIERQSRLDLREVDWDMVGRWVREGEAASPEARLDLYPNLVPAGVLDEYCAALNELLNMMPFEDLDHGDIIMTSDSLREWDERRALTGSVSPTCVVREAGGAIVGMTDVLRHPHEPGIVRQMFTGVHPRARGRGLGKWAKAAMLEYVRGTFPETMWIVTENAGSNASMLAINHALGFRLHREVTYYQVGLERLRGGL